MLSQLLPLGSLGSVLALSVHGSLFWGTTPKASLIIQSNSSHGNCDHVKGSTLSNMCETVLSIGKGCSLFAADAGECDLSSPSRTSGEVSSSLHARPTSSLLIEMSRRSTVCMISGNLPRRLASIGSNSRMISASKSRRTCVGSS